MVPEDYVHRIGRTGRAGVDGDAVSLVCVDEAKLLRDIEARAAPPDPGRGHRGLRARPAHPPRADPSRWSGQRSARAAARRRWTSRPRRRRFRSADARAARSTPGRGASERPCRSGAVEPRPRPATAATPARVRVVAWRIRRSATTGPGLYGWARPPRPGNGNGPRPGPRSSESRGGDDRRPSYGVPRSQQRAEPGEPGPRGLAHGSRRRPRTAAIGPGHGRR